MTGLDRELIRIVSAQRVLTQTQLERLFGSVPGRTLRYRTERLTRLGLLGRSRPYRERGSAPFHYWPTRLADACVRGAPVPRGGERPEPNRLFLAHAERLSELQVSLAVHAPGVGLRLRGFRREGDARERFGADGRERALAPDALIELDDDRDRRLLAFVELDLGTMSHARLKLKAAGYAAYAAEAAWTGRHPFCPCLLFLTTTEQRAIRFLKTLHGLLEKAARGGWHGRRDRISWFAAAACALAHTPQRALVEPCWDDLALSGGGLTLLDCLNASRAPYDAARARERARREAVEAERERLRTDLEARRAHLQRNHFYERGGHLDQFGEPGATALELLLHSREPMDAVGREAFAALRRQLAADPLEAELAPEPEPPTPSDTRAVERLIDSYRARQRARIAELARRYGDGPSLRRWRQELAAGGLIDPFGWEHLEQDARRDREARAEQARLRAAYLERREREARWRKHEAGLVARLAHGRAAVLGLVDRDHLRVCPRCEEIAYPAEPQRDGSGHPLQQRRGERSRCHFCGAYELERWDERHLPQLEHGSAYRRSGLDLRSGAEAGLMDDPDQPDREGGAW